MTKLQDLGLEPLAKPEEVKGGFFFLPIIKISFQIGGHGYGYGGQQSYHQPKSGYGYQAPANNGHKSGKKGY